MPSAVKVGGGVRKSSGWAGRSTKALPAFLAHGTSIENALAITMEGEIRVSPGICGVGVYAFACASDMDQDALGQIWDRTSSGGYNFGAMIVYRPKGVLIAEMPQQEPVPAGATSWKVDFGLLLIDQPWQLPPPLSFSVLPSQLRASVDQLCAGLTG